MKLPDFGDVEVAFLTTYGSHLYGTSTPESDMDLKGVFIPKREDILLGRVSETLSFSSKPSGKGEKNTKDDLDCELYSYAYFLKLALSGQTVALEMLWGCDPDTTQFYDYKMHTKQPDNILIYTEDWHHIAYMRKQFITKNMRAFMGYAKSQAVKYSLKGDKLNTANKVKEALELTYDVKSLIGESFHNLKVVFGNDENVEFTKDQNGLEMMVVCKRAIQETVTVQYALEIVNNVIAKYGVRTKQAADNEGVDYKAVSHAYRIALELRELYLEERIILPFSFERCLLLKDMKRGVFPVNEIMDKLDFVMEDIELIANESKFPDDISPEFREKCNQLIIETYGKRV
jgi:predicted nucleotidyltransferase